MTTPSLKGIGFKATTSDLTCRKYVKHFKYDIGKVYVHTTTLELNHTGFHLCRQLQQTFHFYNPYAMGGNRYFVVSYDDSIGNCCEIYEDNQHSFPQVVTSAIRLEAEIKVGEHLEINDMVKRYPTAHMILYVARYGDSPYAKEMVKKLLEVGADIRSEFYGVLRFISINVHTEVVRMLLNTGADVHAKDDNYALRWVSTLGYTDTVKLLLDRGADVHAQDDQALKLASEKGHTETVKLLLDAGADVHAEDDYALRLASIIGHTEVVKLLLEYGADVHACSELALENASEEGHIEIVKLLLDNGADVHKCAYALPYASLNGHTEVVKLLRDAGA